MIKKFLSVLVVLCTVVLLFSFNASAVSISSEDGYTYDNTQNVITAPDSYEMTAVITGEKIGTEKLNDIADIAVFNEDIYILEKTQGKIIVVDKNCNLKSVLGESLKLSAPEGFFISNKGFIYVADTGNNRIVKLDTKGKLLKTVAAPPKEETLSKVDFTPSKIVVDKGERLYVIVNDETNGIYQMDINGNFLGFFGSVPVVPSLTELFWRSVSTKEQLSRMLLFVPTEYSNMDIDSDGFIYTTVATNTDSEMKSYIKSKGADNTLAPIRRLNPKNNDVLIRTGSMPPAGDLIEATNWKADSGNASRFIDISVKENGVYCVLDSTRGRIFTYDKSGNLLYVFGNISEEKTEFKKPLAVCWSGENIVVADYGNASVKIFSPTEYSEMVNNAILAQKTGNYEESNKYWNEILNKHSGNNLAFIGLGKNELRKGNYTEAMRWFRKADDTENYSKAFKKYRQEIGTKVTGIAISVVVIIALVIWVLKLVNKKRNITKEKKKRPLLEGIKYGFYIMRHPFDGFWDMQFEGRGRISSATVILIATVLLNLVSLFTSGYLFAGNKAADFNVLIQGVMTIVLPFGLWCVANWSVTSLMNGSGTFKFIYMYSCYSLTPFLIATPLLIILSNCLSLDEMTLYTIVRMLFLIWVGFLLFVGTLVVHQYLAMRTVATILVIIVAMGIIVFLFLLCITIVQQMTDFIGLLAEEINLRM